MLSITVTRYTFYGYELEVFKYHEAFWVRIFNKRLTWKTTTGIPARCPKTAMIIAENIVLQQLIDLDSEPCTIFDLQQSDLFISLINEANAKLFGANCIGNTPQNYLFEEEAYNRFLEEVKVNKFHSGILLFKDLHGEPIRAKVHMELIQSPLSLHHRMQGRFIEII